MAEIWIWNSLATRRRAITDTVKESGLYIIKTFLEGHGHQAKIVDWVEPAFYQSLSPRFLAKLNRKVFKQLIRLAKSGRRKTIGFRLLAAITMLLQGVLSSIQKKRMQKKLKGLVQEVISSGVKIIGVKVWYGEAFTWSKRLVAMLKEAGPDILTIAGGYHATLYEEDILRYSNFDLGIVCEGEFALKEVLDIAAKYEDKWDNKKVLEGITAKAEQGQIKNLIYRKGTEIKKTDRYDYTKEEFTIPRYIRDNKINMHVIIASLGCDWAKCNFCVHPYFYKRYFIRPPEDILREMEVMIKEGIGVFRFTGSDTPPFFGAKVAKGILDKGFLVEYSIFGRGMRNAKNSDVYARLVEAYSLMIKSGLRAVFMGGECGNDWINAQVMNKGVTFEDLVFTAKAIREAEKNSGGHIDLSLALIYPAPLLGGEVSLDAVRQDNLRLVREMQPDSVMVSPPGPFKNSAWYLRKQEFGFSFSKDIIPRAMEYEYVLYKPPSLWPDLGVTLEGRPFQKLLEECGVLRKEIEEELRVPTDITDEEFLLLRAAGFKNQQEVLEFKQESLLDIISCDYDYINRAGQKFNQYSLVLAEKNNLRL